METNIAKKIRLACVAADISISELARRINTTPQNLYQRLNVDKFTSEELNQIASALGCTFSVEFVFPDGTRI